MSARRTKPAASPEAALIVADCVVRAARGVMVAPGRVALSGLLFIRDCPAAEFRNDGDGGCNIWRVRAPALFEEFIALAVREMPDTKFEQEDHLVGKLWDAAYLKVSAMRSQL